MRNYLNISRKQRNGFAPGYSLTMLVLCLPLLDNNGSRDYDQTGLGYLCIFNRNVNLIENKLSHFLMHLIKHKNTECSSSKKCTEMFLQTRGPHSISKPS